MVHFPTSLASSLRIEVCDHVFPGYPFSGHCSRDSMLPHGHARILAFGSSQQCPVSARTSMSFARAFARPLPRPT